MLARTAPCVALTIAGSDSSAGAGIQADLKTFATLGVYGVTAITCIVAETPGKVVLIEAAEPEMVRAQVELLLKNMPVAAIKTGLLCRAHLVAIVARTLHDWRRKHSLPKLVVDPVMIATSGDPLLEPDAVDIYERDLFPLATLITPNLDEAVRLTGHAIRNVAEMRRAAKALAQKYCTTVLLKGGHLRGARATDVLHDGTRAREFSAARVSGVATHGTGCTYSAAITAELAKNNDLPKAVKIAKSFVSAAIRYHFSWQQGGEGKVCALNQSQSFRPRR
jgi:phosphomethylpyrimidine kinase